MSRRSGRTESFRGVAAVTPYTGRLLPSICAVSYLNSTPLLWGLLHGPQRGSALVELALPSVCAVRLQTGAADVGLVPSIELNRQRLRPVAGLGIASGGAVRSILLLSKVPFSKIRTLAADSSSRTSVMLARLILAQRFGVQPTLHAAAPEYSSMLRNADAALIIGDPALRIVPEALGYEWLDLGYEWGQLTGLPMVFAVWAAREDAADCEAMLDQSYRYGQQHWPQIIATESAARGFDRELVANYFTQHIRYEIGPRQQKGLDLFLQMARPLDSA